MSVNGSVRALSSDRQRFERAAALAAHELAGPLSTATAAIELLRTRVGADDPVGCDLIATAARQVRIARLQTSRLAQVATGPRTPRTSPTDLAALARQVSDDLALSELAHHPTQVVSDGPAIATADPDLIRQVLYNLLTNAANHSPRGRAITVEVSPEKHRVDLRIRDRGHGVAAEAVARIFEPYERGEADAPGIGLGLALSREIARRHGGDLTLEPTTTQGAVFLLTLPCPASPGCAG